MSISRTKLIRRFTPELPAFSPALLRRPPQFLPRLLRVPLRFPAELLVPPVAPTFPVELLQRPPPRSIPQPLRLFPRLDPSLIPPEVVFIACTAGVWSSTVPFVPCDSFRIEIDGPAADEVRISATLEFQE